MSTSKFFIFNASKIFILQIISRMVSFLAFIYLAKILGVNNFGNFNYILSLCALLSLFIDFGTNQLVVKTIASNTCDKSVLAYILINVSFLKLIQFFLGIIFIVFLDPSLMIYNFTIFNIIFLYTFFEGIAQICISILNGRKYFIKANIYLFSYEVFRSFLILIFLFFTKKINYLPLVYVLCSLIYALIVLSNILSIYHLNISTYFKKLYILKKYLTKNSLLRYYRLSFYFFLSAIAYQLYFRVDVIMMKHLSNKHELGIYTTAYKFFDVFLFIPAIISGMIFPLIVQYYTKDPFAKLKEFIFTIQVKSCILLSFIPVSVILFSNFIINIFFGQAYSDSIKILELIFLTSFIYLYNLIYPVLFNASGSEKIGLFIYLIGFLFNFILNYIFIPRFGSFSAALVTIFSEILVTCLYIYFSKVRFNIPFNIKPILILIIPLFFSLIKIFDSKLQWSFYTSIVCFFIYAIVVFSIFKKHFLIFFKSLKNNAF